MTRIYTPERWLSLFRGYPELVIDDDGFMYNGADYNKFGRTPIGKVDKATGNVYGEDYYSMFPVPISYIQEDDGVKKVYAESDRNKILGAWPILYITDEKIYTYDDYHRLFPTPSGYMERDTVERERDAGARQTPSKAGSSGPSYQENSGTGNPLIVVLVLFLCVVGVLYWLYPPILLSASGVIGILLSFASSVVAYKKKPQKWSEAFATALGVYTITFVALFAMETIFSLFSGNFKPSDLMLILVSPLPGAMTGIVPCAIGAWIVVRIQKSKS